MKKMMVLYNETSGSSESKEIAERFKKAAEARGEAVILQPSNPDIDPEEMRKNVGTGFSKQLFVTTHSPFFVNSLPPEDVWVLEKGEDGFSTAKRASDYKFVKALTEEGATVGDLWYDKYFG